MSRDETLELIGLTKEELQTRVVESIAHKCMVATSIDWDEECGEHERRYPTEFAKVLQKHVTARIDARVKALGDSIVAAEVERMMDEVALQKTNEWGERKKGEEPTTFIEYLVERAEKYLTERVDYDGKANKGYHNDRNVQTRVAHLVEKHLHWSIENAMKAAVQAANENIVGGLEETVKMKLQEIADKMKVSATVKTR